MVVGLLMALGVPNKQPRFDAAQHFLIFSTMWMLRRGNREPAFALGR
jgi:hypothetical protein